MMKLLFRSLSVAFLVIILSPLGVSAQEKTLLYYDSHETEILPDARVAFRNGNYERAILLCKWHSTIVGDDKADPLREKAERCALLTKEMNDFRAAGNIKEAKLRASAILSLNPDDAEAKATLSIEEPSLPAQDTVTVRPPEPPTKPTGNNEALESHHPDSVQLSDGIVQSTTDGVEAAAGPVSHLSSYEPSAMFVIKAGIGFLDMKQLPQSVAPEVAIGYYNVGGSQFGGEVGGYLCSGLQESSASLLGVDASLVYRATDKIYPKLGLGFFSCKPSDKNASSTSGMCAGAGATFMFGGHFCIEAGAKYYPEIRVKVTETVPATSGASYEFPSVKQITNSGIAPFVSVGWSF